MEPLTHYLLHQTRRLTTVLRERLRDDAGYSTETVIITALLAALGIGAVAVITSKVMAKARGIDLGG